MREIFHKLQHKTICEVHTCSNEAKYGIGHEQFPSTWTNLCSECAKALMFEASMLMDENLDDLAGEFAAQSVKQKLEDEETKALQIEQQRIIEQKEQKERERKMAMVEEYIDPITQPLKEGDLERLSETVETLRNDEALLNAISQSPEKINEEIKNIATFYENGKDVQLKENKSELEYYVCKYCGEKFEKPTELGAFRKHSISCYKAHPEKYERVKRNAPKTSKHKKKKK